MIKEKGKRKKEKVGARTLRRRVVSEMGPQDKFPHDLFSNLEYEWVARVPCVHFFLFPFSFFLPTRPHAE
jgi:hypothetical protein